MDGSECTTFVDLEERLDAAIKEGRSVEYVVERSGVEHRCVIEVEDLHALTPKTFLDAAGSIFHPISLMQVLVS